jgi:hypothetical protein
MGNTRGSTTRKLVTMAMPALIGIALSVSLSGETQARSKIQGGNQTCGCTCSVESGGKTVSVDVTYAKTGSSCSTLTGSACNVEVNQQGVNVVRTGSLTGCQSAGGGARAGMTAPTTKPVMKP